MAIAHPYRHGLTAQLSELLGYRGGVGDEREVLRIGIPYRAVVRSGLRSATGHDEVMDEEVAQRVADPDDAAVHKEGAQVVAHVRDGRGVGGA